MNAGNQVATTALLLMKNLKPLLSVDKMKDAGPADLSYEIISCETNNILKKEC
jgi:hypothetical protein